MRILVTGASGFIGSHLVEQLVKKGNKVISFVKPDCDTSFIANTNTNIVSGDLRNFDQIRNATEDVDMVYHLAAIPNWQGEVTRQQYMDVNVTGTNNVFEACRLNGVKRIVFTSSLEAVGPSIDGNPVNEETAAKPTNIYGETKLEGENIAKRFYEKYATEIIIVRLPMVYGPRNLLQLKRYFRIVKCGFYPIVGDGNTLIEFCYVNNAVYGIELAMEKGKPGEIYFISDERSYHFKEVLLEIAKQQNVNLKFLKMPVALAKGLGLSVEILSSFLRFYPFVFEGTGRPAFSRRSVAWMTKSTLFCEIAKAKNCLGYKAPYTLQEGIGETIKWYRQIGML